MTAGAPSSTATHAFERDRQQFAAADACLRLAVEFGANPEARNSIYGPVVPVADQAPVFDRLLGQTGRDPAWTPSSS